ncbi:transcription repressor OFP8-like [Aristolochia californica]|uniref:transcription repressor OFP8-like n=1 Tax=Aristolochia californica TaxID=171875 RepID=UPI0035DFFC64
MERRLKLGISRMFGLSFFSCRNTDASNMAQDPIFISCRDFRYRQKPPLPPLPPVPLPPPLRRFPSICRSRKAMVTAESQKETRTKLCPPAPPASPLNSYCRMQEIDESVEKGKRKKKPRWKRSYRSVKDGKKMFRGKETFDTMVPSTSSADSYCFFSSEEEREVEGTGMLFSRKSLSSDSFSESHWRRRARRWRTGRRKTRPSQENSNSDAQLSYLPRRGRVKGGFPVVKRSSDPHADFRSSMVEMIMEKQIFGVRELEQLLYCFLSLNSPCHHRPILEVFEEICEALFCNWS